MHVDVSVMPGSDYGACYGYVRGPYISGVEQFPLDDGSRVVKVAHAVDFEALAALYVRTLTVKR